MIVGAVVGGLIGAVSAALGGGNGLDIAIGFLAGAAGGLLAASGACVLVQAIGSAAINIISNTAQQLNHIYVQNDQEYFNVADMVADMVADGLVGFMCGSWGGSGASYGNSQGIMSAGKQLIHEGLFNSQAWRNYFVSACRRDGTFVLTALIESLGKAGIGSTAITAKNIVKDILYGDY